MSQDFTDMGTTMQNLMEKLFFRGEHCPECPDGYIYHPPVKNADGTLKPGACPTCGYRQPLGKTAQRNKTTQELTSEALKSQAYAYLGNLSLVPDLRTFNRTFDTFIAKTTAEKKAAAFAKKMVADLADRPPVHIYMNGKAGAGKSHLGTAILLDYLARTGYQKKAIWLDWNQYVDMSRGQNQLAPDRRKYLTKLNTELKTCDLVLIDDFGSELFATTDRDGQEKWSTTQFVVDLANSLFSARVDRNIIITTNLAGIQIKQAYGQRIISRINAHIMQHALHFGEEFEDHRALA